MFIKEKLQGRQGGPEQTFSELGENLTFKPLQWDSTLEDQTYFLKKILKSETIATTN